MRVVATSHAAERFVERVRPGMDPAAASGELERLIAGFGQVVPEPDWLAGYTELAPDFYVEISDGIVVPCRYGREVAFAMTVLIRSSRSPAAQARRARARRRGFTSRGKKKAQAGREHAVVLGPAAEEW